MNLLSELYSLLDLAEEESSVGNIGGMISHSLRYEAMLDDISAALGSYETIYQLLHTHEIYNIDELKIALAKFKALEIVREKNIAITMIKQTQNVKEYNVFAYDFLQIKRVDEEKYKLSPQPLTQKEYDLLKEVLL